MKIGVRIRSRIPQVSSEVRAAMAQGLYALGTDTMTNAKKRTPVDTGALIASGTTHLPQVSGSSVSVNLTFGGAAASYAIYVHEMVHLYHAIGEAKFLEKAVIEMQPKADRYLAQHVARAVGSGNTP